MNATGTPTTSERLTATEAAARLGISVATLRRWTSAGRVPAYRTGPRVLHYRADDLDQLAQPVTSDGSK